MANRLSSLDRDLRRGMVRNFVSQRFLPDSKLATILQDFDLESCLKEADVSPPSLRHEAKEAIQNGGSKVFAILVLMQGHPIHLIEGILKTDQLTGKNLDSRLPFKASELSEAFDLGSTHENLANEDWANEFCTLQWQLISPLFKEDRIHRKLRLETVLPFINSPRLPNSGSYAVVYEVTLDGAHHGFDLGVRGAGPVKIARKELNIDGSDSYENEARILRLIRQLRHENMLQLLASYSIADSAGGWIHNLLFPLAEMTLADLFGGSKCGGLIDYFGSFDNLYTQLYGLSSALESFHFYEDSAENLRLKGCHLDLAPRNILVQNGKLLLADFGLSRLRREASKSCTPFKGDVGDFGAPECFGEDFGPIHDHGSASDIWSLGCILLVTVAFMRSGVGGVADLRKARKYTTRDGIGTTWRFHAQGEMHEGVRQWTKEAECDVSAIQRGLLDLISRMLIISPKLRLNSKDVTTSLYTLAQKSRYRNICEILCSYSKKVSSTKFRIEQERFVIWGAFAGFAVGVDDLNDVGPGWIVSSQEKWGTVSRLLKATFEEVQLLLQTSDPDSPVAPIYIALHELNNDLERVCPDSIRDSILVELTSTITSMYDPGLSTLADLQVSGQEILPSWKRKSTLLAAIKFMVSKARLEPAENQENLRLDEEDIRITEDKKHGRSGPAYGFNMKTSEPLICEWIEYDEHDMDKAPDKLYQRINKLANEFSVEDFASELRVLRCTGYFHSLARTAFGVLYAYPSHADSKSPPTSLHRLMNSNPARPALGALFTLAQLITQSVDSVHEVGWLHKSLNSHNVTFFDDQLSQLKYNPIRNVSAENGTKVRPSPPRASENKQKTSYTPASSSTSNNKWWSWNHRDDSAQSSKSRLESRATIEAPRDSARSPAEVIPSKEVLGIAVFPIPYLIGFNHSRPNDPQTFTRGRTRSAQDYQHFLYLDNPRQRYKLGYDYYSVGLLLLEIGFWTTLGRSSFLNGKSIKDIPHAEQRQIWLEAVPSLTSVMGAVYRDAVELCLSDKLLNLDDAVARREFDYGVVKPLQQCLA